MLPPDVYLRAVPEEWKAQLGVGAIKIVGNLLLPTSGPNRILAHLQPTGLADAATPLMSLAGVATSGGPVGASVLGVTQIAGEFYNGYHTSRLRDAVSTLETMQVAGLALSGIGIGVSIAGFAAIAYKLGKIEARLGLMDEKLDRILDRMAQQQTVRRALDFQRLRTSVDRVDKAWDRSDAEKVWRDEERDLHHMQADFLLLARTALDDGGDVMLADALIDAAAIAGTTRTTALLAAGEMAWASSESAEFAAALVRLTSPLGAATLISARVPVKPGDRDYAAAVAAVRVQAEADSAAFRAREQMAQTAPLTIKRLQALGVGGREWLEAARAERDNPLLLLAGEAVPAQ